ncbi:MAG: branched-chain amino acid ABC transporter permease [Desulfurivibrionaceae bacterium]|jgi:branched-chain amino acid transport system permease protein
MKRHLPLILMVLIAVGVQQLTRATGTGFYLTPLTMAAYYSLVIVGLCLLMGYAGQISLGHAGFFAIGGYLSAMLTTRDLTPYQDTPVLVLLGKLGFTTTGQDMFGAAVLHVHPWAACGCAILVTIIVAYAIGIPVLKLKGHYLAMATLGFGIIIYRLVLASPLFGEADGISEVPGFPLLPGLAVSGDFENRVTNYYIGWGMVALAMWLLVNLIHSRVGRALRAIHGAEDATNAMGVNTARYKLNGFVLSAVLAAMAGIFLTHYNGGIGPSEAGIMKSVRYVAIVAIGGMANLWGALLMGTLLNVMSLRGMFGSYDDAVFGLILIVIMLFAPHGLLGLSLPQGLKRLLKRGE